MGFEQQNLFQTQFSGHEKSLNTIPERHDRLYSSSVCLEVKILESIPLPHSLPSFLPPLLPLTVYHENPFVRHHLCVPFSFSDGATYMRRFLPINQCFFERKKNVDS